MTILSYASGRLTLLTLPFYLRGKKRLEKNLFRVNENAKLAIREKTFDAYIMWEVFTKKVYERKGFEIKPNDIVLDIGAHIGTFAVYAAQKARQGAVFAFEPEPENFDFLRKNKIINRLQNLKTYNLGVNSAGKDFVLYISRSNTAGHSSFPDTSAEKITVKAITLEEIIKKNKLNRVNYLKMDAEGAEFDIILNTPKFILKRVDKIVMEYHDFSSEHNHKDIIQYLESCGFEVFIEGTMLQTLIVKTGTLWAIKRQ